MSYITISSSVGAGAPNASSDVIAVQLMLNHFIRNDWMNGTKKLILDGACGTKTKGAVSNFLSLYAPVEFPTGKISARGDGIKFMNDHAGDLSPGKSVPKAPTKPEKPPVVMPANFIRTIWPKPVGKGRFKPSGKPTNPIPQDTAINFEVGKWESKVKEAGYLALKFTLEGKGEIKATRGEAAKVKSQKKKLFSSGTTLSADEGGKLAHKVTAHLTEKVKVETEMAWSASDLRKFEEAAIKGDFEEIGKDLGAAKINYSIFSWLEAEVSLTPNFPCMFSVQGKFNVPYSLLLEWSKASPAEIASAPDAKIEFAGILSFGPSKKAWDKIGKRLGRQALEAGLKRYGTKFSAAFSKFAARINIALLAIEFVGYEIALFNYLVKSANERGEWTGNMINYTNAYVMKVGGWGSYVFSNANRAPTEKGRRFQKAGIHDADLAMKKWGAKTVAAALVDRFGPGITQDPVEYLDDYEDNCDIIGREFADWVTKNPELVERQVSY